MEAKALSPVEQEVVDGTQDDFLAALLADEPTKAGEEQVRLRTEAKLRQRFLAQPSFQKVIAALHQGDRLRDAAAIASVSVEVARKVLAVMQRA